MKAISFVFINPFSKILLTKKYEFKIDFAASARSHGKYIKCYLPLNEEVL